MVLAINIKEKSGRVLVRGYLGDRFSTGSASDRVPIPGRSSLISQHPVATAPGTDIITAADLLTRLEDIAFAAAGVD
jgi:hypothetical protein